MGRTEPISPSIKSSASAASSDLLNYLYSDMMKGQYIDVCKVGESNRRGKCFQIAQMLSVILLPVGLLLIVMIYFMAITIAEKNQIVQVRAELDFCLQLGRAVEHMQQERDALLLGLNSAERKRFMKFYHMETDAAIAKLPRVKQLSDQLRQLPGIDDYSVSDIKLKLWEMRSVIQLKQSLIDLHITLYTDVINKLQRLQLSIILRLEYKQLWKMLVAYYKLVNSTEEVGRQIQLGGRYLRDGQFSRPGDLSAFLRAVHLNNGFITRMSKYLPRTIETEEKTRGTTLTKLALNVTNSNLLSSIVKFKWINSGNVLTDVFNDRLSMNASDATNVYFDEMNAFRRKIYRLQEDLAVYIGDRVDDYISYQMMMLGIGIFLVVLVVVMCPLLISTVCKLTTQLQQTVLHLADATKELRVEKRRTDSLLYQLIPKPVAQKLKKGETEAEYYKSCSILFCGVNEFANLTSSMTPSHVISLLNDVFCHLDDVTDKHDAYKVETVGDIYMMASGVPERNGHAHARCLANCALDMVNSTSERCNLWSTKVSLLIGINTGSCTAGVIGTNRPRYCLFGDSVNTASRMQTSSQPNKIQITAFTERFLRKTARFLMEPRGRVSIKGKGSMFTFWLLGKANGPGSESEVDRSSSLTTTLSTSSGLGKSYNSFRGNVSLHGQNLSSSSELTPIEQPIMPAISERDQTSSTEVDSTRNSTDNPIAPYEPAFPPGVTGVTSVAPKTPTDDFSDAFVEFEGRFKDQDRSPPIIQPTEGVHY